MRAAPAASSFPATSPPGPVLRCGSCDRVSVMLPPAATPPQVVLISISVPGCVVALPMGAAHLLSATPSHAPDHWVVPRGRQAQGPRPQLTRAHGPPQAPIQLVGERSAPPSPSN
ncbi:hypothetical protein NDU88_007457 [Pleurodeles waltl]|uniref:Uncharacterized protein n=1 Tax=Pleurodeles waltl TaxID=8319 RepID=A0AAV7PP20_PLEWA|nr:hypothetical protein NDU88_007457 [Pleurodeles waltl]